MIIALIAWAFIGLIVFLFTCYFAGRDGLDPSCAASVFLLLFCGPFTWIILAFSVLIGIALGVVKKL